MSYELFYGPIHKGHRPTAGAVVETFGEVEDFLAGGADEEKRKPSWRSTRGHATRRRSVRPPACEGYTLIELMMVVAIIGVLATTGISASVSAIADDISRSWVANQLAALELGLHSVALDAETQIPLEQYVFGGANSGSYVFNNPGAVITHSCSSTATGLPFPDGRRRMPLSNAGCQALGFSLTAPTGGWAGFLPTLDGGGYMWAGHQASPHRMGYHVVRRYVRKGKSTMVLCGEAHVVANQLADVGPLFTQANLQCTGAF